MTPRSLTQLRRATRTTATRAKARSGAEAADRLAAARATPAKRRAGRPRGPERVPLSVRLLVETDVRLTLACAQTGQTPQYLVEDALQLLFKELGVPRPSASAPGVG
ncbi:hypothetical protein OG422_30675 [Streptomyces sp. NBC_01525]|uniref:hypothetical protein n=1 Tax=Streptomyces sp. NBC_01525 TaxID=2903893 RepID=UPI0038652F73